jgi:copper resistance protein C
MGSGEFSMSFTRWNTACVAVLLSVSVLAQAHTNVAGTSPKSGAVLEQSPPAIEINFEQAVRMTSVVVLAAGRPERKLQFSPSGSASTFTVTDPALAPGRNEIQWKALSRDGHVISGSLILVIKPATPP